MTRHLRAPLDGRRLGPGDAVAALALVLVLGPLAPAPAAAQSTPGDFWGTWVRGNAAWFATLPGPPTYLEQPIEGDLYVTPTTFVASAATRAAHPGVDLRLSSELVGGLGVARLRVYTGADTTVGFYGLNGEARALQRYDFTGTVPQTFTIDVFVDALVTGMAAWSGDLRVWDERYDPELEDETSEILASTSFGLPLGGTPVDPEPVTFTLVPGDVVFVTARLSAFAQKVDALPAVADLDHTLTVAFRDGTNLEAASVPEPGLGATLAAGLGMLAWRGRRVGGADR